MGLCPCCLLPVESDGALRGEHLILTDGGAVAIISALQYGLLEVLYGQRHGECESQFIVFLLGEVDELEVIVSFYPDLFGETFAQHFWHYFVEVVFQHGVVYTHRHAESDFRHLEVLSEVLAWCFAKQCLVAGQSDFIVGKGSVE